MKQPFQTAKLTDVARLAGVGNATASRALNGGSLVSEATRKRILDAARDLKYQPNRSAQALKGGRSGMIGMVIPRMSDNFFASCVDAVQAVAVQNASLLVVAATHDCSDRTLEAMKELLHHKVDGLVLASSEYLTPAIVRALRQLPIPAVGIDAPLTEADLPSVLIDNAAMAQRATCHLIDHGYKRVISVQVDPTLYTIKERHKGYEAAMHAAGLEPEQHVIANREDAEALLRAFRDSRVEYAFLAVNEATAKHLSAAAKQLHMIMPRDFAMISFDDFDVSDVMDTPLTVIRQPVGKIGEAAARLLFQDMKDRKEASPSVRQRETVIPAELIVRGSCGCSEPRT